MVGSTHDKKFLTTVVISSPPPWPTLSHPPSANALRSILAASVPPHVGSDFDSLPASSRLGRHCPTRNSLALGLSHVEVPL